MIKKYKKTNDESVLTFRINGMHKQGYEVPILVTLSPTENNHFVLNVEDRSYKHRLEEELRASREHFIILAETATEGIVQIKNDFTVQFANKAIKKIFGYTKDELEQRNIGMLFPDSRYKNYVYLIKKYFFIDDQDRETTGLQNSVEVLGKRKDGDVIPLEISFGNSKGIGNEQILTCIIRDISARKKSERRLKYLAYHDKLTSLGNRDRLHQSLDQFLAEVKRSPDRKGALLFLDLDGFKKVNDSLGHEMGDLILKESAKRLSDCLREEDQVYRIQMQDIFRLGGDEFTILLPNIRHYEDAAVVAKRIIDRILEPFHIEGYGSITNINMGVSVGITLIPDDGTDKNTLLKNADTAMYHAKGKGNTYAFFTEEMNNRAFERLMLEEGLRKAIGTDSFKLHYQPIVNRRGEILGLEALIRWNHPEKGLIPPDTFISIAEDTRLILPLGNWVLETAIRHLRMLHDLGYEHLYMGVNVSPLQLERDDLANRVKSILAKMKVDPCYFTLELTETSIMNDPESAITKMNKLINTNKGMRIAIDDFGTGYSSLNYLSRFPINHLKIDKSFVSNMESENNIKIVNAILSLGHSLGLNTIAEGVETREQLDYLITKNCDSFQGYYFKKPLSYETLLTVLKRQYHAAQISKNKQQRQET
jgi:diguanylate cyclase (GGDEF)-like protein/PAS domain S-box-containing protein